MHSQAQKCFKINPFHQVAMKLLKILKQNFPQAD